MVQKRRDRKSKWVVQYRQFRGPKTGKTETRTFADRDDAIEFENFVAKQRQRFQSGLLVEQEKITFKEYAAKWLKKRSKELTGGTLEGDVRRITIRWLPLIGTKFIDEVTKDEIRTHLDYIQFELGYSSAERNRHRALLHTLFNDALEYDNVKINPVAGIPLKTESRKGAGRVLSQDELDQYLEAIRTHGEKYYILVSLMIWTGARVCSANVIQWSDVDFSEDIITLRRVNERSSRETFERQKGGSETVLPLFPVLKNILRAHKLKASYKAGDDFVATTEDGNSIPYESYQGAHNRALVKAKIARFTAHDLRRTFATLAERAGFSKSEIRDMLGHSSVLVTERYTRADVSHLVEKSKRLNFGVVSQVSVNAVKQRRILKRKGSNNALQHIEIKSKSGA